MMAYMGSDALDMTAYMDSPVHADRGSPVRAAAPERCPATSGLRHGCCLATADSARYLIRRQPCIVRALGDGFPMTKVLACSCDTELLIEPKIDRRFNTAQLRAPSATSGAGPLVTRRNPASRLSHRAFAFSRRSEDVRRGIPLCPKSCSGSAVMGTKCCRPVRRVLAVQMVSMSLCSTGAT